MNSEELKTAIEKYLDVFIEQKISLKTYAINNNVSVYTNATNTILDKGWKGNVVEHILNLKKNNRKGSDYVGLEIKTVPVISTANGYKVKESTCLSVLDTEEVIKYDFYNSFLYKKIKNTLFILIDVIGDPVIVKTFYLDLSKAPNLSKLMENDYQSLSEHIFDNLNNNYTLDHNFTGKLGKVIQPRPKTGKKGNYTWAFYLKASALKEILTHGDLISIKENHHKNKL